MKKSILLLIVASVFIAFTGCSTLPKNTITQISTIDALLAGVYDGHLSCSDLVKNGNFGLGTFNGLDGEMIVLDGKVYQVKSDGRVYTPPPETTTPFAAVSNFEAEKTFEVKKGLDFEALKKRIDAEAPEMNIFCGVKIKGRFTRMKTRSVPGQKKPYPPLVEVTKNQPVFNMENVSGTIVGFRCPAYVKGINVTGYHLHFLSDDLTQGGHILSFTADNGKISIDTYNKFFLILPEKNEAFDKTDLKIDRGDELKKVES